MLILDVAIFSLTLYKAIAIGREVQLLDVIVRDGASRKITYNYLLSLFIPTQGPCTSRMGNSFIFLYEILTFSERVLSIMNLGNILMLRVRHDCIYQLRDLILCLP